MMTSILKAAATLAVCTALMSCDKEYKVPEWEWEEEEETEIKGWTKADMGELPPYIDIYRSPSQMFSKNIKAFIAVADMSKASFEVLGDVSYHQDKNGWGGTSLNTPSDFYAKEKAPVIINAGLFYGANDFYYTMNLVIRDGKLLAPNQNYYSKDWVKLWYPTIGAFCQMKDGSFKAFWTYQGNDGINRAYSEPAPNDINKEPLQVPDASFPVAGSTFEAVNGIGGISVLVHEGKIRNTYVEEMLDVSAATSQPRTAIGITADRKMVLFVCEGRNSAEGIAGMTTAEVAEILKDLGCTEALNLDGGGSSCMVVNGRSTIKESDGKQRKVLTCIAIR